MQWLFFGLVILLTGCIGHEVYKTYRFPRTIFQMAVGFAVGTFMFYTNSVHIDLTGFDKLTNNYYFTLFFPCNIFMLGYMADFHVFRREVYNVWILGVIAYWINTLFTKYVLEYVIFAGQGYDNLELYVIASILGLNNPSVMNDWMVEFGIPLKFRYLISGETYLNGGIATFTYNQFRDQIISHSLTNQIFLYKFFKNAIMGALVGLTLGFFMTQWIRRIIKMDWLVLTLIMSSMFFFAYITVFGGLGISTGITLVFLGLYYAGFGKTFMGRSTYTNVETGINWLGFCLNHFCHFFIGFLMGIRIDSFDKYIGLRDVLNIFIFYFLSYLTRFMSIVVLSPIIKGFANYNLTFKKVLLLTLSNFKIDMSLLIAIFAFTQQAFTERLQVICMFYCTITVIVFHFLAYVFVKPALARLKIAQVNPTREKILKNCQEDVEQLTVQDYQELSKNKYFKYADWGIVGDILGSDLSARIQEEESKKEISHELYDMQRRTIFLNQSKILKNLQSHGAPTNLQPQISQQYLTPYDPRPHMNPNQSHKRLSQLGLRASNMRSDQSDDAQDHNSQVYHLQRQHEKQELMRMSMVRRPTMMEPASESSMKDIRYRFLFALKGNVRVRMDKKYIHYITYQELVNSCDFALDDPQNGKLHIFEYIKQGLFGYQKFNFLQKILRVPILGRYAYYMIARNLTLVHEILSAFLNSSWDILQNIEQFPFPLSSQIQLAKEVQEERTKAEQELIQFEKLFESAVSVIHTKRAAYSYLESIKHEIHKINKKLGFKKYIQNKINQHIDSREQKIENMQIPFKSREIQLSLGTKNTTFMPLTIDQKQKLEALINVKYFPPEDIISDYNKYIGYFCEIERGRVEEIYESGLVVQYNVGQVFGFQNIVDFRGRSKTRVISKSQTYLKMIPIHEIRNMMLENEDFRVLVYKTSLTSLVHIYPEQSGPLRFLDDVDIQQLSFDSKFKILKKNKTHQMINGGYLFDGILCYDEKLTDKIAPQKFKYILPSDRKYLVLHKSFVIEFKNKVLIHEKLAILQKEWKQQNFEINISEEVLSEYSDNLNNHQDIFLRNHENVRRGSEPDKKANHF